MPATSCSPWLERPLAGAFLGFNLLPAGLMHASWEQEPTAACAPDVRNDLWPGGRRRRTRHASMAILRGFPKDQALVDGFADPTLPVFMASQEGFDRLAMFCGLVLLIPSIRRIITRDELQALRAELSESELQFARGGGARWVPADLDPPLMVSIGHVHQQARDLGDEVLLFAIEQALPPVACRARLRLPVNLSTESPRLPPVLRDGGKALALARGVLQELDPEWLALFPTSP